MLTFQKKSEAKKKIPLTIYILQKYKHIKCRNDITLKDGAIYRSYMYCIAVLKKTLTGVTHKF